MSPTPALGTATLAAFRLNSRQPNPYATAFGASSTMPKLNAYDKIPFLKHSIKNNTEFEEDETLDGNAGYSRNDRVSVMPAGSIDCNGAYLGLDSLIAAAMGMEKFRGSALESPAFGVAGSGAAITGTAAGAGSTTVTLTATGTPFTNNSIIGDWVRIQELTTTPNLYDDVRKITGWTSTSVITVAPAWTTIPHSKPFAVAREFLHTFECSKHMHGENFQDIMSGAWGTALSTTRYLNRHGVLVQWNGWQHEEWQFCFVKKMTMKLDPKGGVTFGFELVPMWRDLTNPNAQDRLLWEYVNGSPAVPMAGASFMVYERVLFPDATFRLSTFNTSTPLSSTHNLGVSEFELTVENPLDDAQQTTESGLYRIESARSGKRKIYGSFALPRYTGNTRVNQVQTETDLMASLAFTGSTIATGVSNALSLWMRRMRLETPDTTTPGSGVAPEKHNFKLLHCDAVTGAPNGMPTPTTGNGIENGPLIIQTRNQNPFNAFMGQNQE